MQYRLLNYSHKLELNRYLVSSSDEKVREVFRFDSVFALIQFNDHVIFSQIVLCILLDDTQ